MYSFLILKACTTVQKKPGNISKVLLDAICYQSAPMMQMKVKTNVENSMKPVKIVTLDISLVLFFEFMTDLL